MLHGTKATGRQEAGAAEYIIVELILHVVVVVVVPLCQILRASNHYTKASGAQHATPHSTVGGIRSVASAAVSLISATSDRLPEKSAVQGKRDAGGW